MACIIADRGRDSNCGSAAAMTRPYRDDPGFRAWALSRAARSRLRFRHVDQSHPDDIVTPLQPTLAWPGTDENCRKCHGERQVYYRRASQLGVEVFAASG
jgi:hypothetical protein